MIYLCSVFLPLIVPLTLTHTKTTTYTYMYINFHKIIYEAHVLSKMLCLIEKNRIKDNFTNTHFPKYSEFISNHLILVGISIFFEFLLWC